MVQLDIDQLPGYPCRAIGQTIDAFGNVERTMSLPIPEFDIVCDNEITIMDNSYAQLSPKLTSQIAHFLYGPQNYVSDLHGYEVYRLFLKERHRNNWIERNKYNKPVTVFTHMGKNINLDLKNQIVFKREHLIEMSHPYYSDLVDIYRDYENISWPWATLEIEIDQVRIGDNVLGQIQMYEIDLNVRYYIEVADTTPFTAFRIMS